MLEYVDTILQLVVSTFGKEGGRGGGWWWGGVLPPGSGAVVSTGNTEASMSCKGASGARAKASDGGGT